MKLFGTNNTGQSIWPGHATVNLTFDDALEPRSKQPITFKQDPIALSVAVHRNYVESDGTTQRWIEFDSVLASEQDLQTAEELKKYYKDRIMVKTLKGLNISKYQITLYSILNGEKQVTNDELGMIYRLPYFYAEDQAKERIKETCSRAKVQPALENRASAIRPLTKFMYSRRGGEATEYWFMDEKDCPVLVKVSTTNTLNKLFGGLYKRPYLTVHGMFRPRRDRHHQFNYYELVNMELL